MLNPCERKSETLFCLDWVESRSRKNNVIQSLHATVDPDKYCTSGHNQLPKRSNFITVVRARRHGPYIYQVHACREFDICPNTAEWFWKMTGDAWLYLPDAIDISTQLKPTLSLLAKTDWHRCYGQEALSTGVHTYSYKYCTRCAYQQLRYA